MKPHSIQWRFERQPRRLSPQEFRSRLDEAPEKIEYVDGIFTNDRERLFVLAMLIETLGIDRVVELGDAEMWQAALDERKQRTRR